MLRISQRATGSTESAPHSDEFHVSAPQAEPDTVPAPRAERPIDSPLTLRHWLLRVGTTAALGVLAVSGGCRHCQRCNSLAPAGYSAPRCPSDVPASSCSPEADVAPDGFPSDPPGQPSYQPQVDVPSPPPDDSAPAGPLGTSPLPRPLPIEGRSITPFPPDDEDVPATPPATQQRQSSKPVGQSSPRRTRISEKMDSFFRKTKGTTSAQPGTPLMEKQARRPRPAKIDTDGPVAVRQPVYGSTWSEAVTRPPVRTQPVTLSVPVEVYEFEDANVREEQPQLKPTPEPVARSGEGATQLVSRVSRQQMIHVHETPLTQEPLAITRAALCSEVRGHDQFTAVDATELRPKELVLIYASLSGYTTQRIGAGLQTKTDSVLKIYSAGQEIAEMSLGEAVDVAQSPRDDYYLTHKIRIPEGLAAGDYVFRLIVKDVQGRQAAAHDLPVCLKAP